MPDLTPDNHAHFYELSSDIPIEDLEQLPDNTQIAIGIRDHIIVKGGTMLCVQRCKAHRTWMLPEDHECPDPCADCVYTEVDLTVDDYGLPTEAHHAH